jgi:hypothetical protein
MVFPESSRFYRNLVIGGSVVGATALGLLAKKSRNSRRDTEQLDGGKTKDRVSEMLKVVANETEQVASLKAEQAAVIAELAELARLRAEQELGFKVEKEEVARLKAEKEQVVARLQAEEEEVARLKAEKEQVVARLQAEQKEVIRRLQAEEEEEVARLRAEKEQIVARLQAEQDEVIGRLQAQENTIAQHVQNLATAEKKLNEEIGPKVQLADDLKLQIEEAQLRLAKIHELVEKEAQAALVEVEKREKAQVSSNAKREDDDSSEQTPDPSVEPIYFGNKDTNVGDDEEYLNLIQDTNVDDDEEYLKRIKELEAQLTQTRIDQSKVRAYDAIKTELGLDTPDEITNAIREYAANASTLRLKPSELGQMISELKQLKALKDELAKFLKEPLDGQLHDVMRKLDVQFYKVYENSIKIKELRWAKMQLEEILEAFRVDSWKDFIPALNDQITKFNLLEEAFEDRERDAIYFSKTAQKKIKENIKNWYAKGLLSDIDAKSEEELEEQVEEAEEGSEEGLDYDSGDLQPEI